MAFVDELSFHARAGNGGDGVVRWRREKFIPMGGPAGGDGGRGGNVFIEAARDNQLLSEYRHVKEFAAENAEHGGSGSLHGADGEDKIIKLPIGSYVINTTTGEEYELLTEGERIKVLKGGWGGRGNEAFKSSTNISPEECTPGKPGEEADFHVELRLIADIGFIGQPNAGKSSLLNALTRARAKIGDYAFTTLDPNLGEYFGFIIADIPGIIEGASEGKGLGIKFLKHVARTKALVHLVSFENELARSGGMMKAYTEIRTELSQYGHDLDKKEEIILLTKTDVLPDEVRDEMIAKKTKEFEKLGKNVYVMTQFDDASIKSFSDELVKYLQVK